MEGDRGWTGKRQARVEVENITYMDLSGALFPLYQIWFEIKSFASLAGFPIWLRSAPHPLLLDHIIIFRIFGSLSLSLTPSTQRPLSEEELQCKRTGMEWEDNAWMDVVIKWIIILKCCLRTITGNVKACRVGMAKVLFPTCRLVVYLFIYSLERCIISISKPFRQFH